MLWNNIFYYKIINNLSLKNIFQNILFHHDIMDIH